MKILLARKEVAPTMFELSTYNNKNATAIR